LGKCLRRITPVTGMFIKISRIQKNTSKTQLSASNYGTN
jgi:hypothetical protein